jgi:hypothetical protein
MYKKGEVAYRPLSLPDRVQMPSDQALAAAQSFVGYMRKRHSVRQYATDMVPEAIIVACIAAACTAPSGANRQFTHLCKKRVWFGVWHGSPCIHASWRAGGYWR